MPTSCAVNRCTNNSNKGYAVFNFPLNTEIREKWITALDRNFNWRPTASQRICEVYFNSTDIQLIAGRKQLRRNAIPCHFCTCPYKKKQFKITNHMHSMRPFEDHTYYSENPAKKSLSLQLGSNNTLPHTEHNYFAHAGKETNEFIVKKRSSDANKELRLERNAHIFHCPLLKNPISMRQLRSHLNIDMNQNELDINMNQNISDTDIYQNESYMNSRQALISKIETLSNNNENLK